MNSYLVALTVGGGCLAWYTGVPQIPWGGHRRYFSTREEADVVIQKMAEMEAILEHRVSRMSMPLKMTVVEIPCALRTADELLAGTVRNCSSRELSARSDELTHCHKQLEARFDEIVMNHFRCIPPSKH